MSAAFIRKTPNYPLSHTVFHLLPGKQRLLIRKAVLSTTSLVGGGVEGQMPASPSESLHPEHHSAGRPGCWKLRLHSALDHKVLTQGLERRSVWASYHRCVGRALSPETDGRPRGQPSHHASHTHSLQPQETEVWSHEQKCAGGPAGPSFSLLSFSPSSPAKAATEHSTSKIPVAERGRLRSSPTPSLPIKTSPSRSCRRSRPESPFEDLKEWLPASFVATSLPFLDNSTHSI